MYNPDFDCHCLQDPLFQFYSNAFRELISKASKKVTTINTTEGGAIFGKDILSMKFIEFLEKYSRFLINVLMYFVDMLFSKKIKRFRMFL